MKTKEILVLGLLLWLAFARRPAAETDVRFTITEPGFEGETIPAWPPV